MLCPNCHKEIPSTDRFCMLCGASLIDAKERNLALQNELGKIRQQVTEISGRLSALEHQQSTGESLVEPKAISTEQPAVQDSVSKKPDLEKFPPLSEERLFQKDEAKEVQIDNNVALGLI